MDSSRDQTKISRASRKSRTLSGGGKPKTTGDVAVNYIEGVLGLPTQILGIYSRSWQKPILGQPPRYYSIIPSFNPLSAA
ncbi:MAG: hypothetical protein JRJ86_16220 [Deltaproteobacteria bacterium]|nr:hypothetical protein [Deltaproteobacteria bacterium]MBW2118981.1 hypothetical protein [Deltaproteobacteria bacterium]